MSDFQLNFQGFTFAELFQADSLKQLDQQFLTHLQQQNATLQANLLAYRHCQATFTAIEISQLLLACAPILEHFIADMFGIHEALAASRYQTCQHDPIIEFKKWFVLRRARRRLHQDTLASFTELDAWLTKALEKTLKIRGLQELGDAHYDRELATAQLAQHYLRDANTHAADIEQLTRWCIRALTTPEGQTAVAKWISFRLPQPIIHTQLVTTEPVPNDSVGRLQGQPTMRRQRQGFKLTDWRMSAREVQNEVNYCIYCHAQDDDFCSKGFPIKKSEPQQGFKTDPLGNLLTGCPLTEKISEMHTLKRQGYTVAALAMLMIDNPFCPVTGHRICNDCMKACIYQKQTPVNIPQIETRILTDVLELPWGIEIYDLLTRWNPLRQQQWVLKPYNGVKILIAGQGPAGFTLAHHLLMEGFAVVGIDGLKIEPLPNHFLTKPIIDYAILEEQLDERIMAGFGGVAEYGITVRWDKNFLKLIYLSLLRHPYFQVYGNIRFGGTITVADAWELGFDHVAIAVGAGLPQALSIPGSLASGMRQATDFLMSLQLTGAAKENSLANLQVRLPAIVIGGGLTSIDTATEVQAYYLTQIEKVCRRYEQLSQKFGEARIRSQLDEASLAILGEFLTHAQELRAERARAKLAKTEPNIQNLLHHWGGVTVVYRRTLKESPAYQRNHEEVIKAFEEGIFYLENAEPKAVRVDQYGQVEFLVCERKLQSIVSNSELFNNADARNNENHNQEIILAARSIFVATGAKPNVAYEFEHRGHFQRHGIFQYQPYQDIDGTLQALTTSVTHCKTNDFGPFTSYQQEDHRVTFLGDTHPAFHGSVVKAVASARRTYPHIVKALAKQVAQQLTLSQEEREAEYFTFFAKMQDLLLSRLVQIQRHGPSVVELKIRTPLAAKKFRPGQIFRLQNFETSATISGDTRLQTEALALRCADVDRDNGTLSLLVIELGVNSRLCTTFQPGQWLAVMGPTGVSRKIPSTGETILLISELAGIAEICTLAPALKVAGNRILAIISLPTADAIYGRTLLEANIDVLVWITTAGKPVPISRSQDYSASGNLINIIKRYAAGELTTTPPLLPLTAVTQVIILGNHRLIKAIAEARHTTLQEYFNHSPSFTAECQAPMQCMLKGICAQCLHWQIDSVTGQRTKAVFACSWQDQPLDMIDLSNLQERMIQNGLHEQLNNLWLDYLFITDDSIKRV
jgi:NADPH-dependent glutamate synthase beta subunit-like oxidoreductase/NADPH-dependent ferric siderophore reductase